MSSAPLPGGLDDPCDHYTPGSSLAGCVNGRPVCAYCNYAYEDHMESPDPMLQFFQYAHLPPHLQVASKPFCDLAVTITDTFPRNPERTAALRKLLEAKDCAVRAVLYQS